LPQEGTAQVVRGLPKFDDPNLIVGTESFSDAGVYRLRDDLYIVQTVDFFPPLIDDPYLYGQIAAANSMSDVYAMGADVKTALNVVGFPDKELELEILNAILAGGADKVIEAGGVVVGGHSVRDTEIKYGLAVTGVVSPDRLLTNAGARPGDQLVLTKPLGTGFITTAGKAGKCPDSAMEAAVLSMTQLNHFGADPTCAAVVHSATDVTGFGLAGHAAEMARASGVTIGIDVSRLPSLPSAVELGRQGFKTRASQSNRSFLEGQLQIAEDVDADRAELVFDAQTSGGLLLAVEPAGAAGLLQRARQAGAEQAAVIGEVLVASDTTRVRLRP
jgi:selenide,water dikinase